MFNPPPALRPQVMIGAGGGGPHLIMEQAGLNNVFSHYSTTFKCITMDEFLAADADVVLLGELKPSSPTADPPNTGRSAEDKVDFMHNHAGFCEKPYVQSASYIRVPTSAKSGPRTGASALDIAGAVLHVRTGDSSLDFKSGIKFFDPEVLAERTKNSLCPVDPDKVKYALKSYTNCGIKHTLTQVPQRVVTLYQGATEFMLAMGLEDHMVGTAWLDDTIWPRYKAAYDRIPVLLDPDIGRRSWSSQTEEQIMDVKADFILSSWNSGFAEKRINSDGKVKGIFSAATVGPCDGENSDFFPAGDPNYTHKYSTCRPQLHAAGIGTWLWADYCEDPSLKPVGGATEDTVYDAVTQLGHIFNVPSVARQLIADIRNDFAVAEAALLASGKTGLKAVWLDCIVCCPRLQEGVKDPKKTLFVGGGHGAPNIIMEQSGLVNTFAYAPDSWWCASPEEVMAADPDVMILVDASWDTAVGKIDYLHNHTEFCNLRPVMQAKYIKIDFSASALGPRNGVAALDMVSAALHVVTGDDTINFQSGVGFFEEDMVVDRTANLRCPFVPPVANNTIAKSDAKSDDIPTWTIAVIVVICLLLVAVLTFASVMYYREKQGKPMFTTLVEPLTQDKVTQPAVQLSQRTAATETKPVESKPVESL